MKYKNPVPTVDIIIRLVDEGNNEHVVLISRKNPPPGWALPGGFVDYGESLETAAVREAMEETSLNVTLVRQMHTYSEPSRDPRQHTISTVFIADATGTPVAADDAKDILLIKEDSIPAEMAFDHRKILEDYFEGKF